MSTKSDTLQRRTHENFNDNVAVYLTERGVQYINTSELGRRIPAVPGRAYVAPLWQLVRFLSQGGGSPEQFIAGGGFDLLVQ